MSSSGRHWTKLRTQGESDQRESTGEEKPTQTLGRERNAGNPGIYPNAASPLPMTKTDKVTTLPQACVTVYLTLKSRSARWSLPRPSLCYPSHPHQRWQWVYRQNTAMISGGGAMMVASVVTSLRCTRSPSKQKVLFLLICMSHCYGLSWCLLHL